MKSTSSSIDFPNPRETLADGLVAVGGKMDVPTLLAAYSKGIFPWPQEGLPYLWFSPEKRGIIFFNEFHIPKSLVKFKKKHSHLRFTINQNFTEVIKQCQQQARPDQNGTWILPEMICAYEELFKSGFCISAEVWDNHELIGGLYGVFINNVFSGESMFYKKKNASKLALWHMVNHLQTLGLQWMDIQMVTPVTAAFGGRYISRNAYLKLLAQK